MKLLLLFVCVAASASSFFLHASAIKLRGTPDSLAIAEKSTCAAIKRAGRCRKRNGCAWQKSKCVRSAVRSTIDPCEKNHVSAQELYDQSAQSHRELVSLVADEEAAKKANDLIYHEINPKSTCQFGDGPLCSIKSVGAFLADPEGELKRARELYLQHDDCQGDEDFIGHCEDLFEASAGHATKGLEIALPLMKKYGLEWPLASTLDEKKKQADQQMEASQTDLVVLWGETEEDCKKGWPAKAKALVLSTVCDRNKRLAQELYDQSVQSHKELRSFIADEEVAKEANDLIYHEIKSTCQSEDGPLCSIKSVGAFLADPEGELKRARELYLQHDDCQGDEDFIGHCEDLFEASAGHAKKGLELALPLMKKYGLGWPVASTLDDKKKQANQRMEDSQSDLITLWSETEEDCKKGWSAGMTFLVSRSNTMKP